MLKYQELMLGCHRLYGGFIAISSLTGPVFVKHFLRMRGVFKFLSAGDSNFLHHLRKPQSRF